MKGLEELHFIIDVLGNFIGKCGTDTIHKIGNANLIIANELKALEIIRKYGLCEEGLIAESMRNYNKFSQEERDLLKEVLKNE